MKAILITLAISLLALAFAWVYKQGENKNELQTQKEENTEQQLIIEDSRKIYKRRVSSVNTTSDNAVEWLRQNICQDC